MGRAFCETLLDYSDENPNKVMKRLILKKKIKKIRKHERAQRRAAKATKVAATAAAALVANDSD